MLVANFVLLVTLNLNTIVQEKDARLMHALCKMH